MNAVLTDEKELKFRVYEIPTSAIMVNERKLKYFDFISSLSNEGCNSALRRIVPKIDMRRIADIIDETPFITDLQKSFYKTMLQSRKQYILDYSLAALNNAER